MTWKKLDKGKHRITVTATCVTNNIKTISEAFTYKFKAVG